jgi:hypothetical protein
MPPISGGRDMMPCIASAIVVLSKVAIGSQQEPRVGKGREIGSNYVVNH